jgi:Protein of unknown function (DUF2865)
MLERRSSGCSTADLLSRIGAQCPASLLSLALSIVALGVVWAAQSPMLGRPEVSSSSASETPILLTTTGEMLVTAERFDLIFNETRRRSDAELKRSVRQGGDRRSSNGGTYRTLCVRLSDGFHFPVSDSTRRERLSGDAKQCEQRCPARSRLFVHRNPGEGVDDMVDLQGHPYRNLPTALLYQTKFVADCTCHGNPWDEAALARHRTYAEDASKKLAGKTANPRGQLQSARRE